MTWLAHLSFAQAVRWALVWPASLLGATILALVVVLRWQRDWAFGVNVSPAGALPVWLAVSLATGAVVFGPPLVFLALWRVAHV
jgi:hypothetical protein